MIQLSLHPDQAGGDWNKEQKAVGSEITYRGRNEWGVGKVKDNERQDVIVRKPGIQNQKDWV